MTPAGDAARLSEADLRQVQQLKARDREVRAHEQAHLAAGGSLARGGASYTYERGPDGRSYAVGGEVQIASARVPGDPEATAQRAEQVQRAATAPASPSAQDRAVAAQAAALATQARAEANSETSKESRTQATTESSDHASQAVGQNSAAANGIGVQNIASKDSTGSSEGPAETNNASAGPEIALYKSVASLEEHSSSGYDDFQTVTV